MNDVIAYAIVYGTLVFLATLFVAITQWLHARAYRRHCAYLLTLMSAVAEKHRREAARNKTTHEKSTENP